MIRDMDLDDCQMHGLLNYEYVPGLLHSGRLSEAALMTVVRPDVAAMLAGSPLPAVARAELARREALDV